MPLVTEQEVCDQLKLAPADCAARQKREAQQLQSAKEHCSKISDQEWRNSCVIHCGTQLYPGETVLECVLKTEQGYERQLREEQQDTNLLIALFGIAALFALGAWWFLRERRLARENKPI